ncbi:MAG: hypothetical protein AB1649_26460 [Chloroflexota bacterium]
MAKTLRLLGILILLTTACNIATPTSLPPAPSTETLPALDTSIPDALTPDTPTPTFTPIPTHTPAPTATSTQIPVVESIKATVTADLLSCRYGPGAEYLYLYALRKTANIELIGRTDGNNWVLVQGKNLCWVNTKFLEIQGDPRTLKVMYPGDYKLPVSPYYSSPAVLRAVRDPNNPSLVTVEWTEIALRAGDEEDENMFIYIIEVWRCEGGKIIFDPLPSNYPVIQFIDEPGCDVPSHGRVYFQEKHGYAGPAEIPWPEH